MSTIPRRRGLLKQYEKNEGVILKHIFESFNTNDRGISSTLIRDVSQVQIRFMMTLAQLFRKPLALAELGMHPSSLAPKRWEALQKRGRTWNGSVKRHSPFKNR